MHEPRIWTAKVALDNGAEATFTIRADTREAALAAARERAATLPALWKQSHRSDENPPARVLSVQVAPT